MALSKEDLALIASLINASKAPEAAPAFQPAKGKKAAAPAEKPAEKPAKGKKAAAPAEKPAEKPAKKFLEVEYGGSGLKATLEDGRKILIKRMRSGRGLYAELV